ncbi:acyl-CoA N-acyltransferase [Lactarius quietus]|nr:acyl-CoA N-acyltransferase [Lactarius quietus]
MLTMANDAEVQAQVSLDAVVPKTETWKETPQKWADKPGLFVVVELKDTGEMIGTLSLNTGFPKNRDATLGIALRRGFLGMGYGTEAIKWAVGYGFKELGLHRVQLTVNETNERAIAAYRKVGFVEEGRLRKALWKGGKFVDIILMAILEDEWSSQTD